MNSKINIINLLEFPVIFERTDGKEPSALTIYPTSMDKEPLPIRLFVLTRNTGNINDIPVLEDHFFELELPKYKKDVIYIVQPFVANLIGNKRKDVYTVVEDPITDESGNRYYVTDHLRSIRKRRNIFMNKGLQDKILQDMLSISSSVGIGVLLFPYMLTRFSNLTQLGGFVFLTGIMSTLLFRPIYRWIIHSYNVRHYEVPYNDIID
jgi:hypothetical protein